MRFWPWMVCASLCCWLFIHAALAADTAYVTDELQLRVYAGEKASGKVLATVESGTRLGVLTRQSFYAKVRTPDGTTGWVKASFLVKDKPSKLRLKELQQEKSALKKSLQQARAKLAEPRAEVRQAELALRERLAKVQQKAGKARQRAKKLSFERDLANSELNLSQSTGRTPYLGWWYLGVTGILFILGVLIGGRFVDHRQRRRLSGYRLAK